MGYSTEMLDLWTIEIRITFVPNSSWYFTEGTKSLKMFLDNVFGPNLRSLFTTQKVQK